MGKDVIDRSIVDIVATIKCEHVNIRGNGQCVGMGIDPIGHFGPIRALAKPCVISHCCWSNPRFGRDPMI
jgi:hypothetical protein